MPTHRQGRDDDRVWRIGDRRDLQRPGRIRIAVEETLMGMTIRLQRGLMLGVLLLLGYVTLVGGGAISGSVFRWQLVTFCLGVSLFAGWLLWRGVLRRARWPLTGLEWPLGGAALVGILSLLASPDWRPGLARLSELAVWAALFYLAVDLLAAGFPRRILSRALVMVSGLALFAGVLEVYSHYLGHGQDLFRWPLYRLVSLLGHSNLLAGLATLTLPLVLWEWRSDRRVWVRSGLLLWGVSYLVVLPFTSSRSGLVGLVVILAAWGAWLLWGRGPGALRKLIESLRGRGWIAGIAVGGAAIVLVGLFIYQSLHPSHGDLFGGRFYIWEVAAKVIAAHFWLGAGPGRFGVEAARVLSIPPDYWPSHAHSLFWQAFAEFGLVGLLALVGLSVAVAHAVWRSVKASAWESRVEMVFIVIGILGYSPQMLLDDHTHVLAMMAPLALVLALLVAARPLPCGRIPLVVIGLPLLVIAVLQAQWLWAYAAFDQARLVYDAGDATRALRLTQEAARRDPSFSFYDVEAGLLAAQQDDWPAAQAYFERAAAREGSLAFVWANLGVARWRNGDRSGGLAALQSAAQLAPASPTILLTAGWMAEAAGQPEAAATHYRAALALRPDWADRPFWDASPMRSAAKAAVPSPIPDPRDPYPQARAALAVGDVARAREWMDLGLNDPNLAPRRRVEWQMLFGDVLRAEGDEAGAMKQYLGALAEFANPSIEGTGATFWNTYGVWLNQRQTFEFDSVPGLMPLDVTPEMLARFGELSIWLRARGDCATALAVDRQRRQLDPGAAVSPCP
jgi:O-antigen ligase